MAATVYANAPSLWLHYGCTRRTRMSRRWHELAGSSRCGLHYLSRSNWQWRCCVSDLNRVANKRSVQLNSKFAHQFVNFSCSYCHGSISHAPTSRATPRDDLAFIGGSLIAVCKLPFLSVCRELQRTQPREMSHRIGNEATPSSIFLR